MQIFQACSHALCRRDGSVSELDVLLYHAPARIAILFQGAEKAGEIDVSLADDREHFMFNGLFEGPLFRPGFLQYFLVAILEVDKTQLALELLGFPYRITQTVNAMTGIESQTYIGVRSGVKKSLALLGSLHVGGDVRMKHQVQPEFVGHLFRIGNQLAHMLPLLRG